MRSLPTTLQLIFVAATSLLLLTNGGVAQQAKSKRTYDHGNDLLKVDDAAAQRYTRSSSKPLPETRFGNLDPRAKSFDWTKRIALSGVQRQSGGKTCWAHAVTAALEWNWAIRNTPGKMPNLSAQPIIDRAGVDAGQPIAMAFEILLHHGTALESDYHGNGRPGPLKSVKTPYRIVAWGGVSGSKKQPTVEQIKEALVKHGPLTASVYSTPAFHKYKGGVFSEFAQAPADDPTTHYIVIVGWDDAKGKKGAWRIQNSWGAKWGDHGFMWIEYECNNIGYYARWMRAQSIHYPLPTDAHRKLTAGDPFPGWSKSAVAADEKKMEAAADAKSPAEEMSGEEPISPAEAKDRVGDRIWVRMTVAGTATHPKGHCELYSEKSWRDPNCFIVRVPAEAFAAFKIEDVKELRDRYRGKSILAEGKVEKVDTKEGERRVLLVTGPKSISIVEDRD